MLGGRIELKIVIERGDAITDLARDAQLGLNIHEGLCREIPQTTLDRLQHRKQRCARILHGPGRFCQSGLKGLLRVHRMVSPAGPTDSCDFPVQGWPANRDTSRSESTTTSSAVK